MWADVSNYVSSIAVIANPYDWAEMSVWRRYLKPGYVFVDVGAHVGVYTLWAIDLDADVIAFEPVPEFVAALRENLALNKKSAEIVECALSDHPGTMFMSPQLGGASHLEGDRVDEAMVEVRVMTLDDALRGRRVDGLKIDVEGAERRVLAGGRETIRRIGLIQLEWNDQSQAYFGESRRPVAEILSEEGFVLTRPTSEGTLRRVADPNSLGSDVFAVSLRHEAAAALIQD